MRFALMKYTCARTWRRCSPSSPSRCILQAELTGFEPAISCVTGRHVRPLHHSSIWLRGQDLNLRPSDYEPDELPTAPPRVIKFIENKCLQLIVFLINTISYF